MHHGDRRVAARAVAQATITRRPGAVDTHEDHRAPHVAVRESLTPPCSPTARSGHSA